MTKRNGLLFLGLFLLFIGLSPGWFTEHDPTARLAISRALWQNATVFLKNARPERFVQTPSGLTSYQGIGQSLLFIPFDIMGFALSQIPSLKDLWQGQIQVMPLVFLYAPLVGLFWFWSLLQLAIAFKIEEFESRRMIALLFLSSISIVYVTQSLQEEPLIARFLNEIGYRKDSLF